MYNTISGRVKPFSWLINNAFKAKLFSRQQQQRSKQSAAHRIENSLSGSFSPAIVFVFVQLRLLFYIRAQAGQSQGFVKAIP